MSYTRHADQAGIVEAVAESDGKYADPFHEPWITQGSRPFSLPQLYAMRTLRGLYPKHSIVQFENRTGFSIFSFPGAKITIPSPTDSVSYLAFESSARAKSGVPGILRDRVEFGFYNVKWDDDEFILYSIQYDAGDWSPMIHYLLYEGPEARSRQLLLAAAAWNSQIHEEIFVFERNMWKASRELWVEVQKASWDDIILKPQFKDALRNDIHGFFESKALYEDLAVTWKRGIILLGPPGNGKTMTMKAVMKDCCDRGYAALYVKSAENTPVRTQDVMSSLFEKARKMAPSLLILEDLDSFITDQNRSIFLNQLDGLENNDGLLVIGTTNHFEKLDPALSGRPSRFDRKYAFGDPDEEERRLYAKYWQDKLRSNEALSFPDSLVSEIAASTGRFSFANIKEAFISALVVLAGLKDDKPSFATVMKDQTRILHEQLNKDPRDVSK